MQPELIVQASPSASSIIRYSISFPWPSELLVTVADRIHAGACAGRCFWKKCLPVMPSG